MRGWASGGLLGVCVLTSCADFERPRTEAVDPSVPEGIQAHLAEREYHASENGQGLQAPNRAHNLRTYFDASGIRVHDRTAGGSPELLRLSLSGVGREGALAAVEAGSEIVADENRVEIHRPGLVEWFVNGPDGLEQGFTIAEKPEGEGELRLELMLAGAQATLRGGDLIFTTATGRRLSYGKLAAFDAQGAALAAELAVADAGHIEVSVDDAGAAYPILIDPLLAETSDTLLEADEASARLGMSVASAGDVNGDGYGDVIVGADRYDNGEGSEGAAFVFLGSASGILDAGVANAHAQLEGDQPSAQLGASVASAGDVNGDGYADVIVGAPGYDEDQTDEGGAFIFLGSASGIAAGNPDTAHAKLQSDQALASLGKSVASAGDVNGDGYADVIVGADGYDNVEVNEGAAFLFLGSASGVADGNPTNAHALLESDQGSASLGFSVASAGDVNGDGYADVIVGAWGYDDGQSNEGAAFVFQGSASGVASGTAASAHAQLEGNQAGAQVGRSVASAGDVNGDGYADMIVGAPTYDSGEFAVNSGGAFVFHGSATGVSDGSPDSAHSRIFGSGAPADSGLGNSVASAGDVNGDGYSDVIVGASTWNHFSQTEGVAWVFLGGAAGLVQTVPQFTYAQLERGQALASMGRSVASAGDVNGDGYADVIVGAYGYDNGEADEGAAFIYHGGATGFVDSLPAGRVTGLQSDGELGFSVATAGDVNADGYSDAIIGAPGYDNGQSDEGVAFIFHGSATGLPTGNGLPSLAQTQLESDQANARLGRSVAPAGDVNGDGYADVIVGAPLYSSGEANEGAAFVFLGSASGITDGNPATAYARLESDQASASMGSSVASAGDVNGDGHADVIVGADLYDSGQADEGAAFVFLGTPSGVAGSNPTTAHAQLESDQASAFLGQSVASAGDVNGDGYADVIVGAPAYDNGDADEGAAFVFLGSASALADGNPASAHAQLEADQATARLGQSVAPAGDVNGDRYADVIVGSPFYDSGHADEGAAFVFLGGASGVADGDPTSAHAQLESDQASAFLGVSVASAGDVNGDGYADVVVGANGYESVQPDEGAAFVFLGGASGVQDGNPAGAHADLGKFHQAGASLGVSVASAGDVNGDGFADVIVGGNLYGGTLLTASGQAYVYQGGSYGQGRRVLARQQRGDGSGIAVQPWGGSHSDARFVAELRASHPQGMGRVKARFEACPQAVPFGDASCTTATTPSWIAVTGTTPDVLISHTFTDLTDDTLYRWRARVLHAPATGAIPANPTHGPWRRPGAQSAEADIRVVPEPEALLSLASSAALLVALARRRKRESSA